MDFIVVIIGRALLNFIGGTLRYIYVSIWRTLFDKPKFTFKEYINGPKKSNYYDEHGHQFNNLMIGFIFILIIAFSLASYYP